MFKFAALATVSASTFAMPDETELVRVYVPNDFVSKMIGFGGKLQVRMAMIEASHEFKRLQNAVDKWLQDETMKQLAEDAQFD